MSTHILRVTTRKRALVAGVLVAVLATAILSSNLDSSSAATGKRAGVATITMRLDGKRLFFTGPRTIERGRVLRIRNATDPRQIGPHTFSLVNPNLIPRTKQARKSCFAPGHICRRIARWHGVDGQGPVTVNPVDTGRPGWNTLGNRGTRYGDSWVAERQGATFARRVSAGPGKVLTYLCAIHPNMHGSIRVLPGS